MGRDHKTCNHARMCSGVYEIRCIITDKIYVGSSICIPCRWNDHVRQLNNGKHRNTYLQGAWNKYSGSNFAFTVLEECSWDKLIVCEQQWLDATHCTDRSIGYNRSPIAQSQLGLKLSAESKKKISLAKSNPSAETRERIRIKLIGKKQSQETCIKKSVSSATKRLSKNAIIEIQERYESSGRLITQTQLAKEYGVSNHTISCVVRRVHPRYQTDVPLCGEPIGKLNGIASLSPEKRKHTQERREHMSVKMMGHPNFRRGMKWK